VSHLLGMMAAMDPIDAINALATRQHAAFTTAQARAAGMSADAITHRIDSGMWRRLRPGVLAPAGAPPTWEQAVMAAVLAAGPGAVASHVTAARLWELPGIDADRLELTTDRPRWLRLEGVTAHRVKTFLAIEHSVRRRVPTTGVARTLVDMSGRLTVAQLGSAADVAQRKGSLRLEDLRLCVAGLLPARGRNLGRMHAVLRKRLPGYDPGDSDLEMRVLRAIVEAGLPEPELQHRVVLAGRRRRIDLAYPELKLAIEVDGWDTHRTRSAFDADRARENELVVAGWRVLRFTSAADIAQIVATVSAALAALSRTAG